MNFQTTPISNQDSEDLREGLERSEIQFPPSGSCSDLVPQTHKVKTALCTISSHKLTPKEKKPTGCGYSKAGHSSAPVHRGGTKGHRKRKRKNGGKHAKPVRHNGIGQLNNHPPPYLKQSLLERVDHLRWCLGTITPRKSFGRVVIFCSGPFHDCFTFNGSPQPPGPKFLYRY